MSETKLMPKEPTPAMCEAMEAYYRKWAGILGGSEDHIKAQCWATLHAYRAMFEACPGPCPHDLFPEECGLCDDARLPQGESDK
jgi:hypothetical protein